MGLRRTLIAFGIAALLALPWFLAAPGAFLDDTLRFHVTLAARSDSLSICVLATRGGLADVLQPLRRCWSSSRPRSPRRSLCGDSPRTTLGFTLGAALVLFTFAIVNKQSFYNHYALVLALILLAIALLLRGDDEVDVTATPPQAT